MRGVLTRLESSKIVFFSAGGTCEALPDTLVGWRGGYPLPIHPPRRLQRLVFSAFGALHLCAFGALIQTPQADRLATGLFC